MGGLSDERIRTALSTFLTKDDEINDLIFWLKKSNKAISFHSSYTELDSLARCGEKLVNRAHNHITYSGVTDLNYGNENNGNYKGEESVGGNQYNLNYFSSNSENDDGFNYNNNNNNNSNNNNNHNNNSNNNNNNDNDNISNISSKVVVNPDSCSEIGYCKNYNKNTHNNNNNNTYNNNNSNNSNSNNNSSSNNNNNYNYNNYNNNNNHNNKDKQVEGITNNEIYYNLNNSNYYDSSVAYSSCRYDNYSYVTHVIGSKAERSRGYYSGLNKRKGGVGEGEGEVWTEENNRKYMLPVVQRVEKREKRGDGDGDAVGGGGGECEGGVGGRDRGGKGGEEEEGGGKAGSESEGDDVRWGAGVFNDNVRYSLYGQGENNNKQNKTQNQNQNQNQNADSRDRANSIEQEKGKISPNKNSRSRSIDSTHCENNDYSHLSVSKINHKITDNIRCKLDDDKSGKSYTETVNTGNENPEISQNFHKSGSREYYENKEYKEVKENREKKILKKREKSTLNNSEYSLWGLEDDLFNKNKKNNSQYEIKKRINDDGKNRGVEDDKSVGLHSEHWLDICSSGGGGVSGSVSGVGGSSAGVGGGNGCVGGGCDSVLKKEKDKGIGTGREIGIGIGKDSEKKVNFDEHQSERVNASTTHTVRNNKINKDKQDSHKNNNNNVNNNNNSYRAALGQKKDQCMSEMNRQYIKQNSPSKNKKNDKNGGKSDINNICDNHGNSRDNSDTKNTDNFRKHGNGNGNGNYEKRRVEPDNSQEMYSLCTYPLKRRKHTDADYLYGESYYSSFPLNNTNSGQDSYSSSSTSNSTSFPSSSPSFPSSCSLLHSLVDVLEKHQVQDSLSTSNTTSFPPSHTTSFPPSHNIPPYPCSLLPLASNYPRSAPDFNILSSNSSHPAASLYSDDVRDHLDVAI